MNTRQVLVHESVGVDPAVRLPLTRAAHPQLKVETFADWGDARLKMNSPRSASSSPGSALPPCAAVAPLCRDLAAEEDYLAFLDAARKTAAQDETFRLYLVPEHGSKLDDIVMDPDAAPSLLEIVDSIHLPTACGEEAWTEIDHALNAHLMQLTDLEDLVGYRRRLQRILAAAALLSVPALLLAVIAGAISLAPALWPAIDLGQLPASAHSLLSAGLGILLLECLLLAVTNHRQRMPLLLILGLLLWRLPALPVAWPPLITGLALALALGLLRRRWLLLLPLSLPGIDVGDSGRAGWLARSLGPFSRSLFPRRRRVFLSYARQTWAGPVVSALRQALAPRGVDCFYDEQDIELGSCWWHVLADELRRSTLFLFFRQGWGQRPHRVHQAELAAACEQIRRVGLPRARLVVPEASSLEPLEAYRLLTFAW